MSTYEVVYYVGQPDYWSLWFPGRKPKKKTFDKAVKSAKKVSSEVPGFFAVQKTELVYIRNPRAIEKLFLWGKEFVPGYDWPKAIADPENNLYLGQVYSSLFDGDKFTATASSNANDYSSPTSIRFSITDKSQDVAKFNSTIIGLNEVKRLRDYLNKVLIEAGRE